VQKLLEQIEVLFRVNEGQLLIELLHSFISYVCFVGFDLGSSVGLHDVSYEGETVVDIKANCP